jgi:hypothetical protein
MICLTGTFTIETIFALPKIHTAFKKAIQSQGSNPKTKVINASHYETLKFLNSGNINVSERKKSVYNTRINYIIPVVVAYNKNNLGSNLNLTSKELKNIINCTINGKSYKPWKKVPLITTGAVRGHSGHGLALYTGLPYDRVAQVTEHPDIEKLGDNFVNELINKRGFDLVVAPLALMENYFTGDFDISKIDGKNPQERGYKLNDYLLYASHNGKQLEMQEAISNALNDVRLRKELKKVGIIHSNNEQCIERLRKKRPDLF